MTDDDYVAELRSYGMLSTNQAADRIEALTAERDEARKKFDDTDLCWNGFAPCGWSLTLIDKADTAEPERDRLRAALWGILACETPNANATVTRMVAITLAALKGETP